MRLFLRLIGILFLTLFLRPSSLKKKKKNVQLLEQQEMTACSRQIRITVDVSMETHSTLMSFTGVWMESFTPRRYTHSVYDVMSHTGNVTLSIFSSDIFSLLQQQNSD